MDLAADSESLLRFRWKQGDFALPADTGDSVQMDVVGPMCLVCDDCSAACTVVEFRCATPPGSNEPVSTNDCSHGSGLFDSTFGS